jgi:hypothetical protein
MPGHVRATAEVTPWFQMTPPMVTSPRVARPVDSASVQVTFPDVTAAPHGCGAVSVLNVDVAGVSLPAICANAGL